MQSLIMRDADNNLILNASILPETYSPVELEREAQWLYSTTTSNSVWFALTETTETGERVAVKKFMLTSTGQIQTF